MDNQSREHSIATSRRTQANAAVNLVMDRM